MPVFGNKKEAKRKIRTRNKKTSFDKWFRTHTSTIKKIALASGLILFLIACFIVFRILFYGSKNTISTVIFSPESIEAYDDPELYTVVQKEILWKNYYSLTRGWLKDIVAEVKEIYPLINEVTIEQSGPWRGYVNIVFHTPTIVFQSPSWFTAAYENSLYYLASWNTLGNDVLTIDIPRYTSWYDSLHGILYPIDEVALVTYIQTILDTLGEQHIAEIIYLPGWMKLFIAYKSKKVYFHLDQEVNRQLAKLVDMENWYQDFENTQVIDLWSIDDIIVR